MVKRHAHTVEQHDVREAVLRPSRYLGYDHDAIAVYLIGRQAYEIAESELRRAVWLNPFEPAFQSHLAWCLYKQGKYPEAMEWVEKVLAQTPDHVEAQSIRALIQPKLGERQNRP